MKTQTETKYIDNNNKITNCIFIALLLKALYNGSFIHTLGSEAANIRHQWWQADTYRTIGLTTNPTLDAECLFKSLE